ncbi:MAG: hypothetical protein MI923_30205 [Phycisphaerales bacterium]|nr:hypothetical protein [Phycisphaerales bacterium]
MQRRYCLKVRSTLRLHEPGNVRRDIRSVDDIVIIALREAGCDFNHRAAWGAKCTDGILCF